MIAIQVTKVDREKRHDPFYKMIKKFEGHPLLPIAFSSEYGKQALILIPDGESPLKAVLRHTYHFLGGLGNLLPLQPILPSGSKIQPTLNPILIFDCAVKSYKEFKEALRHHDLEQKWFQHLSSLRYLCLEGKNRNILPIYMPI